MSEPPVTRPGPTRGGDPKADQLAHRLSTRRQLARLALIFEQIWPAVWPALGVAGLFLVAALLDVPQYLPPWLHLALLGATAIAIAALLWRGLSAIRRPDQAAADRRLERASGLAHRPLTTITDRPAMADAAGMALWRAHLDRAARQIGRLRVGPPRPGLAARDPRALRGALLVALAAAVVIAGPDAGSRLLQALRPDFTTPPPGISTQVQAWITPPAYTRLAPTFLKAEGGPVSAPAGSRLTISVTGGTDIPSLSFAGKAEDLRSLDATSFQADRGLAQGGRMVLRRTGREMAAWDITAIPDQPPVASWPESPGPGQRAILIRLPWQVADDYGVVSLQAEFRLRDRAAAPPLAIALPLTGGTPAAARGASVQDLSAHPWAGLAVTITLTAKDAIGQTGTSAPVTLTLPERPFEHPVARVLIAVRKQLSLTPEDRVGALKGLRPLMLAPESLTGDFGAWLNLSAIAATIARNKTLTAIEDAQARMWDLAVHLEEGGTERTARALEQARREAREALERAERDPQNAERRAELERKLQELNEAIRRHLEALANQARREMSEIPPELERLNPREMDRLAKEAEQAAREGKMDEARERMAELERMLDEMRNAQAGREQNQQRNAERRQRGRQQMGALQDMIGREGQLMDNSQRRSGPPPDPRTQRGQPQQSQPRQSPAEQQASRQADQRVQQALRRALGELMQQFGDLTGKIPPALNEADQAMREAAEALGAGRDSSAARAEQRAIEALQRGGREMGQQMARQFGRSRGGESEEGDGDGDPFGMGFSLQDGQSDRDGGSQGEQPGRRGGRNDQRDPLGRQMGQGTSGADESSDVRVPDEMERQRTQALQQELRRRGGERFRSQEELDYIDRLLRRF